MPIYYWDKIHSTGNLAYLIRTKSVHIGKAKPNRFRQYALGILWRKLLDEYIERFGFSENFLEIIRKEKEIFIYRVKRIVESDRSVNAFIKIAEQEMEELKTSEKGGNFWQSKAYIEKGMGFTIDPMRVSVAEFYSYFAIIAQQNKRMANNE